MVRWKNTEVPTDRSLDYRRTQTSLAAVESLAVPLVQEVVFLADFRCVMCQERVAEIMSRMNGEIQTVVISVTEKKAFYMAMRINLDCNACCRKMRRILQGMKDVETHLIEKHQNTVTVYGRFVPADVAIKIRKRMKRRVEILDIQEADNAINGHVEEMPPVFAQPVSTF